MELKRETTTTKQGAAIKCVTNVITTFRRTFYLVP